MVKNDEFCVNCDPEDLLQNGIEGPSSEGFAPVSLYNKETAKAMADKAHNSGVAPISQLTHWPIQLHLIGYGSKVFDNADLLVAADCAAYANAHFHEKILRGRKLVIACPKLDNNKEVYIQKLKGLIDNSIINTITIAMMEVPCCSSLLQIVKIAVERSIRKVPIKQILISVNGDIRSEEWLS